MGVSWVASGVSGKRKLDRSVGMDTTTAIG